MVTTVTMPVPLILVLPLLVLGALGGGDAAVVQAVVVAVDRRGHKRDREDAAVLSRPVRVGDGGDGDGGAKRRGHRPRPGDVAVYRI